MALIKQPSQHLDGQERREQPRTVADLVSALRHAEADVRRWAARDLDGLDEAAPALLAALPQETDRGTRDALLATLAGTSDPAVVRLLAEHLRSEDAGLRNAVAEALARMPLGGEVAREWADDPDADVRILVVMVLTRTDDPLGRATLEHLVRHDPDARVVASSVAALEQTGQCPAELVVAAHGRFPDDPFLEFLVEHATHRRARP